MEATFPGNVEFVVSGVTDAVWPIETSPICDTPTSVEMSYSDPGPTTTMLGLADADPLLTESPGATETEATVPLIVETRLTSFRASWAWTRLT